MSAPVARTSRLAATALALLVAAAPAVAAVVTPEGPARSGESGFSTDILPSSPLVDPASALERIARPGIVAPATRPRASSTAVRAVETLVAGKTADALRLAEQDIRDVGPTAAMLEVSAVAKLLSGNADEGLALLRKAVLVDPAQTTAWVKLGDVLMRRGDLAAAETALREATRLADEPQAHQRLGLIAETRGADAEAIAHYRKGLVGTPAGYVGIAENLALLLARRGEGREAVAVLAPRLDPREPRHRSAFLTLASARLVAGDGAGAMSDVRSAIALGDRSPETAIMLAIAARRAGRFDDARQALEPLVGAPSPRAAALLELGEIELAAGNAAAAQVAFDRLVAQTPDSQPAWRRLTQLHLAKGDVAGGERGLAVLGGLARPSDATLAFLVDARRALNQWDQAEAAARRRIDLAPDNPEAQFGLGSLLAAVRRYDEAVVPLRVAATRAPLDLRYQRTLALAELRRGDFAAATRAAQAAAALPGASADDLFLVGTLLERQQQRAEAEQVYERAIAAQPEHGPALNNLAMLKLEKGRSGEAIALAERASRALPDTPAVLGTYASALVASKRAKDAAAPLARALQLAPSDPALYLQSADLQLRLGNRATARQHAERVLALAPDGELAPRARALLAKTR